MFEDDFDNYQVPEAEEPGMFEIPVILSSDQIDKLNSLSQYTGLDYHELIRRAVNMLLEKGQQDSADWKSAKAAIDHMWEYDPEIVTEPLHDDKKDEGPEK